MLKIYTIDLPYLKTKLNNAIVKLLEKNSYVFKKNFVYFSLDRK